jgi:hypothetical protein
MVWTKLSLRPFIVVAFFVAVLLGTDIGVFAQNNSRTWQDIKGKAQQIAIGAKGDIAAVSPDGRVYKYDIPTGDWSSIGEGFSQVAIDSEGYIWGIDRQSVLRQYTGTQWRAIGEGAIDLSIAPDDTLFIVTNQNKIAQYMPDKRQWTTIQGSAERITVDGSGKLWRLSEQGRIARMLDDAWIGVPGNAKRISSDNVGRVFITQRDGKIAQWNEEAANWFDAFPEIAATNFAAGNNQFVYVDKNGNIFATGLQNYKGTDSEIVEGVKGDGAIDGNAIPTDEPIVFTKLNDNTKLSDIAIGREGSVFGLTSSGHIRRWSNKEDQFNEFPGQVDHLVVKPDGLLLAIGTKSNLVEHDGEAWRLVNLNQDLIDLTVFDDNKVLAINSRDQTLKLSKTMTAFTLLPQRGQQIAAQNDGLFWVIDSVHRLFKCSAEGQCERQSVNAEDIAIGPGGSVFVVDTNATLRRFNGADKSFDIIRQGNTARVAVGPHDRPWILDNQGRVLQSGFFERYEGGDRNLALKTKATKDVTQEQNNTNTGIQITQSISFTSVTIPTSAGGVNLGSGMLDITSGEDDIVVATGFDDPCVNGTGRNWVYNSVSRTFGYLDYLKSANFYTAIALDDLIKSVEANGDKPPSSPSPAIPSLLAEWNKNCGNESELLTYVSSVFSSSNAQSTQNFAAATLSLPLDDNQIPDLDVAGDGTIAGLISGNKLEIYTAKSFDKIIKDFDDLQYHRVGIGEDKDDIWVVSLTNNVYEYIPSTQKFDLRSFNANDKAQDIGVGHDGTVFIVNTSGVLKKWDPLAKRFIKTNKSNVTRVAVDSRGNPIVANFPSSQIVYFGR